MFLSKRKKYQSMSDSELLISIQSNGDSQLILSEVYSRYAHLIMGTCMKYLKNVQDAEDVTMSLFEKLPNKLVSHNIQNLNGWLYMVSKNECLMKLRKKGIPSSDVPIELTKSDEETYDELKELSLQILEQEIENLKPIQRDCIKLFYLESKSYNEITSLLKLDIKKVKSAIQNGKRNLQIKLEGNV